MSSVGWGEKQILGFAKDDRKKARTKAKARAKAKDKRSAG
jgi:hypothetical protein